MSNSLLLETEFLTSNDYDSQSWARDLWVHSWVLLDMSRKSRFIVVVIFKMSGKSRFIVVVFKT